MAAGYVSDITLFLRELKAENPDLERQQRAGRAIWWDKDVDPDLYRRFRDSTLPQPAYVYQPKAG
ncbi:MAG: DUF3460 family protein [Burkholderiaceae bacterium]|jgi:hypothetical protein|nr:DUF3460 family protein [Burkholderiaceae bacterium]MDH5208145.1 DUF3460 family protein [Burkholderiaceae bacterium]